MQTFLGFPAYVLATYFAFSLLSHFFCIFSLFSFHPRVCLSFKLPFSILRSLVSPSCSCFFSYSSMVDYSAVRVGCPLIAFLFARLGCLLKSIEEECLKWVNLFMGEDCPHKFVLSSLFPLVSHSTKVARLLKMSEVRSSDLETGLSSSDDHVISETASPSTLTKPGQFRVPLRERMKSRSGIGFSSLIP